VKVSKTSKTIAGVCVALAAIIGFGIYWLANNLDGIVAGAIEKVGSEVTGVPVRVSAVSISLKEGTGEIRGLTIGNPDGFSSDHALRLNSIRIVLDTSTITSDPVRIKQISVDGSELVAEVSVGSGINLAKINDNLKTGADGSEPSSGESAGPKLVIDQFDFTNAAMTVKTPVSQDKSQKLGDVHVRNIGEGSGGATPAQVGVQLLRPVLQEAVKAARKEAGNLGIEGYKEGAVDKLKDKLGIGK
jgi:hypothetical protein